MLIAISASAMLIHTRAVYILCQHESLGWNTGHWVLFGSLFSPSYHEQVALHCQNPSSTCLPFLIANCGTHTDMLKNWVMITTIKHQTLGNYMPRTNRVRHAWAFSCAECYICSNCGLRTLIQDHLKDVRALPHGPRLGRLNRWIYEPANEAYEDMTQPGKWKPHFSIRFLMNASPPAFTKGWKVND